MYPHERSLVKRLAGKPFALIGVNSDRDKKALKEVMKKENITWRSFWNGPQGTRGPISSAWGVRGWPTIYVLDHNGIIRFKNVRGKAMDKAVDTLLEDTPALPPGSDKTSQTSSSNLREWTDKTGTYKLLAEFVEFKNGKPSFKKEDGTIVAVPLKKLSKKDQQFIRDLLKERN